MIIKIESLEKLLETLRVRKEEYSDELVSKALDELEKIKTADFWTNWTYPEGATPEYIQNELSDFRMIMKEVSKVYDSLTNGRISKVTTKAEVVISTIEEIYRDKFLDDMMDETRYD